MRLIVLFVVPTLWASSIVVAQTPGDVSSPELQQQIQTWIEMLDSRRYGDRVEASVKLGRLGVSAIDALEQVAGRGPAEPSDRAFEILKRHLGSEDSGLSEAANAALRRIAEQADHPKSKAAERLLRPAEPTEPNAIPLRLPAMPPRAFNFNQRIQIQVKIAGEDKDITVVENGKKIRLIENADGIQVEKSDGKGGIIKNKFKNAAELKQKDAEAYKVYQRGSGENPFNRRALPIVPGQPRPARPALPDEVRKRHEEILKRHQEMRKKHKEEIREPMRRLRPVPTLPPRRNPIELKASETLEV